MKPAMPSPGRRPGRVATPYSVLREDRHAVSLVAMARPPSTRTAPRKEDADEEKGQGQRFRERSERGSADPESRDSDHHRAVPHVPCGHEQATQPLRTMPRAGKWDR